METILFDGFELGFHDQDGISELTIPNGWHIDWIEGDGYSRPEADEKRKPQPEVFSGHSAASIQTTNGHKHKAVLWRRFAAEPGKMYRASVQAMGLTHTEGDSGAGMRVGFDLEGKYRLTDETFTKWGQWYDQYHKDETDPIPWRDGKWVELSCVAEAKSDWITVFLWTSCDWPKGAMAHFDDFLLQVEDDESPPENGDIVTQLSRMADALEKLAALDWGEAQSRLCIQAISRQMREL